ncbi:hypothetical protein BJ138DRAFT_1151507 [Hygrophoropsis aurantiaca]|uniref:Uncharacterized protein n=1 Tax=Hygrophoropsis aurantiaca TaxID=72124 RepID=A0ACB8AD75_9AGAM|nr:hypothetical protein BJ138DRAFT_1151507 [Hygrophoropsis aurantiaca]
MRSTFALIFTAFGAIAVSAAVTPHKSFCEMHPGLCSEFSPDVPPPVHPSPNVPVASPTPDMCTHKGICLTHSDCCGTHQCDNGKCT